MDLKHVALLLAVAAPLGASPAFAGELELPLGVSWCEVQSNVEFSMEDPREVAGDVLESTASVWGMEGFVHVEYGHNVCGLTAQAAITVAAKVLAAAR